MHAIASADLATSVIVDAHQLKGWRDRFGQMHSALVLADKLTADGLGLARALEDRKQEIENLSQAVAEYLQTIQTLRQTALSREGSRAVNSPEGPIQFCTA